MANADRSSAVAAVQDALSSAMESMLAEYRRTSTDPRAAEAFAQRIRAQQAAFYDRLEQVVESAPATPVQPRSGPYATESDEALILTLQQHGPTSRAAANALTGRYYREINRYALYRTGYDDALADDVTQETFVRMLERIDQFKVGEYPFIAWLKGIAKFLAIDLQRRKSRAVSLTTGDDDAEYDIESQAEGQDTTVERADLTNRILLVAERLLDETEKRILALHYGSDRSTQEIADELGMAQGTVKRKLKEARDEIKNSRSVQEMMGRESNPPDEEAFDRLLREAFGGYAHREHNPPDDYGPLPPEVALQVGLAELRTAYPHPIDQGYAAGCLMHLVTGSPAPRTFAIEPGRKIAIEDTARRIAARVYGG
jgi:RNA polymerase sigma-70 factor (ECF subfamily)